MTAETTFQTQGLAAAVEIRIDRWGIAHIKAETQADAFFAQGWNAARDRLWQIDIWRKRGLGLLAADFGPAWCPSAGIPAAVRARRRRCRPDRR